MIPSNGIFPIFKGRFKSRNFSLFISVGTLYDLNKMHHKSERYIWPGNVHSSGINGYFWLIDENNEKIKSFIPALDTLRYENRCSIEVLKEKLKTDNTNYNNKFNEMLMGASLDSLNALFATVDDRPHRLAVLHAHVLLYHDYGITRPLLIIDGKSKPTEYSSTQIKADLIAGINKYRRWYWRLLHCLISTREQQILLEIIRFISLDGLKISDQQLINYFTKEASPFASSAEGFYSEHPSVEVALPSVVVCDATSYHAVQSSSVKNKNKQGFCIFTEAKLYDLCQKILECINDLEKFLIQYQRSISISILYYAKDLVMGCRFTSDRKILAHNMEDHLKMLKKQCGELNNIESAKIFVRNSINYFSCCSKKSKKGRLYSNVNMFNSNMEKIRHDIEYSCALYTKFC